MVQSLVIHLGDRKAGSTSIQATLAAHFRPARNARICYPTLRNHTALARTITDSDQYEKQSERFPRLVRTLDASDAQVGVISSERFEMADPRLLRRALETYMPQYLDRMRLITYLRPHVPKIVSSWAQQLKMGKTRADLHAFHEKGLENSRYHYMPRLTAWREVFGDAFCVRLMDRSHLTGGSVVQDFLSFATGEPGFTAPEMQANESSTLEELALMRLFHGADAPRKGLRKVHLTAALRMARQLAAQPRPPGQAGATRPAMHQEMVDRLRDIYSADARAVDAAFFATPRLAPALDAARGIATAQSVRAEDHFPDWELRLYQALTTLFDDMAEIGPKGLANHLADLKQPQESPA